MMVLLAVDDVSDKRIELFKKRLTDHSLLIADVNVPELKERCTYADIIVAFDSDTNIAVKNWHNKLLHLPIDPDATDEQIDSVWPTFESAVFVMENANGQD